MKMKQIGCNISLLPYLAILFSSLPFIWCFLRVLETRRKRQTPSCASRGSRKHFRDEIRLNQTCEIPGWPAGRPGPARKARPAGRAGPGRAGLSYNSWPGKSPKKPDFEKEKKFCHFFNHKFKLPR